MNSKFINVLFFAAGAVIGSAVTWKVVKTQYEKIVQEELDSIREAFAGNEPDVAQEHTEDSDDEDQRRTSRQINWDELEDLDEEEDEEILEEYARLADVYKNDEEGGAKSMPKRPYVISPYDFGEIDEYKQFELTYYADGILEDEDYEIVTDVDELIGEDSLNTFGEYEDDAVFVRNENLNADFQILKDYRTYTEARGISPDRVNNE
jgi:hypothetical protein